ncbi:MAG: hypothetical protein NC489_34420 [Ruminococcus flavefaciens]|nr:hypothetical protein [Ruminococcus flavefaciens]
MDAKYAKEKAEILVRDHNHYKKYGDKAVCADYKMALDLLIYSAARIGCKISYTVSKNGMLTLVG